MNNVRIKAVGGAFIFFLILKKRMSSECGKLLKDLSVDEILTSGLSQSQFFPY
jgi:hypothetical protein